MFNKNKNSEEALLNKVSNRVDSHSTNEDVKPTGEFKQLLEEKPVEPETKKHRFRHFKNWFKSLPKKQKFVFVSGILLAFGAIGSSVFWFATRPEPAQPVVQEVKVEETPPAPTTEPSRLTGVQVDPALNKRPVTGVMIENSPDARPQSGLNQAGVVFEAVAEGGITRFLALFQEAQPKRLGPVRSARPYYIDWLHGFDGSLAHAGGSAEALFKIKKEKTKDLDQFYNGSYYQRASNRVAPHNLYTSMDQLDKLNKSKGYTTSVFTGFPRKEEKKLKVPTAREITINMSGFYYNTTYKYDRKTNTYKRWMAGKPHTDQKSGDQLAPKVLIAAVMPWYRSANGVNTTYEHLGSGKCFVFQDGGVTIGTWKKKYKESLISFWDKAGKPITLNPGQTWIAAPGHNYDVSFKP